MIWGLAALVVGALLIAFGVWMRQAERKFLAELAAIANDRRTATDPWEEPRIVKTLGGIHDVEEDQWQ